LPTKIKIWHEWKPCPEIKNHQINKMFENYNKLIKKIFTKINYESNYKSNLPILLKLAKKIGL